MGDFKFRRKVDYPENVFEEISLLRKKSDKILIVPNKTQILCYYQGLRLVDISEKVWNIFSAEPYIKKWENDKTMESVLNELQKEHNGGKNTEKKRESDKEFFFKHIDLLLCCLEKGLTRDQERRSQQVIALNNMSFDDDVYSVCGVEVSISSKYFSGDAAKSPGIDLVVLNPKSNDLKIVEYKCKKKSALDATPNVKDHCKDFLGIIEKKEEIKFVDEMINAFNFYRKLNGKKLIDNKDFNVSLGFLISSSPISSLEDKDHINDDAYKKIAEVLNDYLIQKSNEITLPSVSYITTNNPDKVKLDEWDKALKLPRD